MEKLKLFNQKTGDYLVISQKYPGSIIDITSYFINSEGVKIKYSHIQDAIFNDVHQEARYHTSDTIGSDYKIVKKDMIFYKNILLTLLKKTSKDENWDYYIDDNKQVYYIAKNRGCESGWFGDLNHYNKTMQLRGI